MTSERGSNLKRRLDSWIGRPLLFVVGSLRRRRRQPMEVHHIGLMMLAAIGDTIVASGLVIDLRCAFPNARITAFVTKANRGVMDLLDGFDAVVDVPVTRPLSAVRTVRRYPVDLLIDIGQWTRMTPLLAALSRARFTIGFGTPGQQRHWAFDAVAEHSNDRHEVENFRALVSCVGVEGRAPPCLRQIPHEHPAPSLASYVLFHPWASGHRSHLREWATGNWVEVAKFVMDLGFGIVITGGPGDISRANELARAIARPLNTMVLAGRANLKDTALALFHADAVVAVNTGTMHLAALMNRPMVALHGPTNPRRWGPLGDNAIVVGPGPDEGGAFLNLGFEYPRLPPDCMGKIAPAEVIGHLKKILMPQTRRVSGEAEMAI